MTQVSKKESKGRSYQQRVADGEKLVHLWLDGDKWEQIKAAADSVQEPITTWIRRAAFAALRKWEIPRSIQLFEPCSICGKKHNRQEHFGES